MDLSIIPGSRWFHLWNASPTKKSCFPFPNLILLLYILTWLMAAQPTHTCRPETLGGFQMQNLNINFNFSFLFHPLRPIITTSYWFYVCNVSEARLLWTALIKPFSSSDYFRSFITGLLLSYLPITPYIIFFSFFFAFYKIVMSMLLFWSNIFHIYTTFYLYM